MEAYDLLNMLQNNNSRNPHNNTLKNILDTIKRHKWFLVIPVLAGILIAVIFNIISVPQYEASVLLKKEKIERGAQGDFSGIFNMAKEDVIETEMRLIQTRNVIEQTVYDLKSYFVIESIDDNVNGNLAVGKLYPEYDYETNENSEYRNMPKILSFEAELTDTSRYYMIKKMLPRLFNIYDAKTGKYLGHSNDEKIAVFELPGLSLQLDWINAKEGSKLFFTILGYSAALGNVRSAVNVERVENTDIIEIKARGGSPLMAKLIANTLAENFKKTRMNQQKEIISASYPFIDQQMLEASDKLKTAEENLSSYRAANNLISLDAKSSNLIDFLSSLEAEKVNTELQLLEYENRKNEIEKEYRNKGVFDQTLLTPERTNQQYSAFITYQQQLSALELQKIELLKKRKENHPDIVNLNEQIEQLKDEMNRSNQNTLGAYQILINTGTRKIEEINKLLGKYTGQMVGIPSQENQLAELMRERAVFEKIFTLLLNKREELRIAELTKLQDMIVVEPAILPSSVISPKKELNVILGFIAGLLAGIALTLISDRLNNKIEDLEEIEDQIKLPILGIIPEYSRKSIKLLENSTDYNDRFIVLMNNIEKYKESFNFLKIKIEKAISGNPKIVMFTSCEEHTGKTSILAHTAVMIAKTNKRVLLIDCDLKRSRLSELFDISTDSPGLYGYLSNGETLPTTYNLIKIKENGKSIRTLDIIPSGGITSDSSELMNSEKMMQLLKLIKSSYYDYVFFDTPPATRVVDALLLGSLIKNTVVTIRPGFTHKDSIQWGIKEMELNGLTILGTVVNACNVENSSFRFRYGYSYKYDYKSGSKQGKNSKENIEPLEIKSELT